MRRERLLASPRGSARPPEYGTWTPRDRISEEDIAYDPAQFLFHTNPAANRRSRCLDPDVVSCLRAAGRGTAAVLAFAPTPLLSALSSVSVLACLANTHTHTHTHIRTDRLRVFLSSSCRQFTSRAMPTACAAVDILLPLLLLLARARALLALISFSNIRLSNTFKISI